MGKTGVFEDMSDSFEYTAYFLQDATDQELTELDQCEIIRALARQIEALQTYRQQVHSLIPQQYKKLFPKSGENPFFSKNDFKIPDDSEELQKAKERMSAYAKQQTSAECPSVPESQGENPLKHPS